MEYRIIEQQPAHRDVVLGTYDSAYAAVDEFRRALLEGNLRVWNWYLVDDIGTILFGPSDLASIAADAPAA